MNVTRNVETFNPFLYYFLVRCVVVGLNTMLSDFFFIPVTLVWVVVSRVITLSKIRFKPAWTFQEQYIKGKKPLF